MCVYGIQSKLRGKERWLLCVCVCVRVCMLACVRARLYEKESWNGHFCSAKQSAWRLRHTSRTQVARRRRRRRKDHLKDNVQRLISFLLLWLLRSHLSRQQNCLQMHLPNPIVFWSVEQSIHKRAAGSCALCGRLRNPRHVVMSRTRSLRTSSKAATLVSRASERSRSESARARRWTRTSGGNYYFRQHSAAR